MPNERKTKPGYGFYGFYGSHA